MRKLDLIFLMLLITGGGDSEQDCCDWGNEWTTNLTMFPTEHLWR
jgi:hypothetical protein